MTDLLRAKIDAAETLQTLEDIYLPFRPKKRTKATIAREKGLEPLAELIWEQESRDGCGRRGRETAAGHEYTPDTGVAGGAQPEKIANAAEALQGARDILAERINDDATARARLRELYLNHGVIKSKVVSGKEEEGAKFKDYFDWTEPASAAPSHRILAIRRGESEGFLFSRLTPSEDEALGMLERLFVKGTSPAAAQVKLAVQDCLKRLLGFAMEGEARLTYKKKADEEAIRVFADNLRELLLASPLGRKNMLAIDPGFRTGCKVVVLDRQGKLLENEVVYPEKSTHQQIEATEVLRTREEALDRGNRHRQRHRIARDRGFRQKRSSFRVRSRSSSSTNPARRSTRLPRWLARNSRITT